MKIYAINGSPRKKWNTATMLENFCKGADAAGAETETIHLYDLNFKGCVSCNVCKRKGPLYGKCGYKDELSPILEMLAVADGIAFASPIYFHDITAQLRGLLERLFFQYHSLDEGGSSLAPKKIPTAMIYTMNVTEDRMREDKYPENLSATELYLQYTFFYDVDILYAFDTYEFDDYSKYHASYWNEAEKAAWRKNQFPLDCQKAYHCGQSMVEKIKSN